MLLSSSNDAATALARTAGEALLKRDGKDGDAMARFVEEMNKKAQALGLSDMTFTNPTGLDYKAHGGQASAHNVALLAEYIIKHKPNLVAGTRDDFFYRTDIAGRRKKFENTNPTALRVPGLILSKTGYTGVAGGNLVTVFDVSLGHKVAVVVLGSTYDGRFNDMLNLRSAVLEYFSS